MSAGSISAERRRQQRLERRLERRAIAGYQKDKLDSVRRLAAERSAIGSLETRTSPRDITIVRLQLPGWTLSLAGVVPAYGRHLASLAATGAPMQLVDGGRYGRLWWITVFDGCSLTVVAGSHLRLTLFGGGIRRHAVVGLAGIS